MQREVSTTKNYVIYTRLRGLSCAPRKLRGEYKLFILITARGRNFHFIIKQTARNFKYFGVAPGHKCLGILSLPLPATKLKTHSSAFSARQYFLQIPGLLSFSRSLFYMLFTCPSTVMHANCST